MVDEWWRDNSNEEPEEDGTYLVLWKSRLSNRVWYGMCEYFDGNWVVKGMPQYKSYGAYKMEILYWMGLPKLPEDISDCNPYRDRRNV